MFNIVRKEIPLPNGQKVEIETGRLARQADGSVVIRIGDTMILATVVSSPDVREGTDFLPLSVDYQEKFASAGRIPGGFLKREGRLSDYEVLICRLVDRAMRPLFPKDYHHDTQINIQLISSDGKTPPDAYAALAASTALAASDIPFDGPISEVRVVSKGGEFLVNPTLEEKEGAELDLIVAATYDNILMVEGEMAEVSEDLMLEALKVAHDEIKVHCQVQNELTEALGKTEKRDYIKDPVDEELEEKVFTAVYDKLYAVAASATANKTARKEGFSGVKSEFIESLPEDHGYDMVLVKRYLAAAEKKACRRLVLDEKKRLDGRDPREVRQLDIQVDVLPTTHGSALFTRGETQSLTSVTLGTKLDEQMIDGAMHQGTNRFMLHYNFPGFSTGEVRPNRGPGRREVGHGNLANRAISKVLPANEENPYTIRVVSDILESNGSSSMATVCAGSLALMDAGIPISGGVSGIAMGMVSDSETGQYTILSDILGDEDHLGDMDFKVTGTAKGLTACQMDIKVDGLSYEVLKEALMQANEGRSHILKAMNGVLETPRADLKSHAPRSVIIEIPKDLIGAVIGPGGKVVQEIQKVSGATVVIEEKENCGNVNIFATDQTAMESAQGMVQEIIAEPEEGKVYDGVVKNIQTFGAFVEFMKGKEGLLHISEISWERLENMDGVFKEGDEVQVKLLEVDKRSGKFRLSRKVLLEKPEGYVEPERKPRGNGGGRGDRDRDRNRSRRRD